MNLTLLASYLEPYYYEFINQMDGVLSVVLTIGYSAIMISSLIVYAYEIANEAVVEVIRPQILEFKLACLSVYGIGQMKHNQDVLYTVICDHDCELVESLEIDVFEENISKINKETNKLRFLSSISNKEDDRCWKQFRNNQHKTVNK